ncbi:MAG: Co2+/Mg2+ efflux protein ApaG [Bacteroidota bacterium]
METKLMASQTSSRLTNGIRVNVRSAYIRDESSPKHQYFVFAYQIEIINESDYRVQLLSREWHITDGYGQKQIVRGEGVVGKQPILQPGQSHKYVSGSHFQTPIGRMHGHYIMQRQLDDATFSVDIPAFIMEVPHLSN